MMKILLRSKYIAALACLFAMSLTLSGCVLFLKKTTAGPTVEIVPGQWVQLPTPQQLTFNLTATQILTASYHIKGHTHTYTSQVQVEKTPQHVILVAVAGWGGSIFSIKYDGTTIKTSSLPMPHATVGIGHVLTDFILTYAKPALLRKLLKTTDISLKFRQHKRILLQHSKPILTIAYQMKNPWKGVVVVDNLLLHYSIRIQTVSYKNMSFGSHIDA